MKAKNKTTEAPKENNWNWVIPSDFRYSGIDYDYDTDNSNCRCPDYCRCSKIVNKRITDVDLNSITEFIHRDIISKSKKSKEQKINDTFLKYCIHRLAVLNHMYDTDNWYLSTCSGYYGEEIKDVIWEGGKQIEIDISEVINKSPNERIEYVLVKEYGYLLPRLQGKKYIEELVSVEDIAVGNEQYIKKVDSGHYNDGYNLPIGIYEFDGHKYRIIDGYHRYIAFQNTKKEIPIIVAH